MGVQLENRHPPHATHPSTSRLGRCCLGPTSARLLLLARRLQLQQLLHAVQQQQGEHGVWPRPQEVGGAACRQPGSQECFSQRAIHLRMLDTSQQPTQRVAAGG